MFKVTIEELDRKDCLLTLRLNINNEYESGLIINPYDCFDSIIHNYFLIHSKVLLAKYSFFYVIGASLFLKFG